MAKKITLRQTPVFSRNETSRYTDLLPSGKSRQFSFNMMPKSIITEPSFGDKLEKAILQYMVLPGQEFL